MIEGVRRYSHEWHEDDRGSLRELWRSSWADGEVRQVYVTETRPGVVKAWHYHGKQTDRFVVLVGVVRLVLYDGREDSPTYGEIEEYVLSPDRSPCTVTIPPASIARARPWGDRGVPIAPAPAVPPRVPPVASGTRSRGNCIPALDRLR